MDDSGNDIVDSVYRYMLFATCWVVGWMSVASPYPIVLHGSWFMVHGSWADG